MEYKGFKFWVLLLFLCSPVVVWARDYFTAAVFEHRPRSEIDLTANPKDIIASNLKYYERAAKFAADQGADIILFNEYGLFPYSKNREVLKTFMEQVPDPENGIFNPCSDSSGDFPILPTLSCMAKKNNIYVVANMIDMQPCEEACDAKEIKGCSPKCPENGVWMYNTDVAFDRSGNLLAKYHKMHPYFENLNVPEEEEYITFKTEFGTFGMIVCFDSVFNNAMILARDKGIDTLLFPTFWFDDVVPFNAVEWQQSWAIANNVNFFAANTQTPGNGSLGSGIYSKDYGALAYTYEPDGESKVVIANVPIGKLKNKSDLKSSIYVVKENEITVKEETGDGFPEHGYYEILGPEEDHYLDYRYFKSQTENFTLVKVEKSSGHVSSCNNGFCCSLTYSADDMTEEYYLASFSGFNNVRGYYHWCEEVCLLIRCDPAHNKFCVMQPSRSKTIFRSLKLSAHFTSERIHPTVSTNKFRLASKREWKLERKGNEAVLEFKSRAMEPLLKAGLLGRCYARDPPFIPFFDINGNSKEEIRFVF